MWFNRWVHRETGVPPVFGKESKLLVRFMSQKTMNQLLSGQFFYFAEPLNRKESSGQ